MQTSESSYGPESWSRGGRLDPSANVLEYRVVDVDASYDRTAIIPVDIYRKSVV